MLKVLIIGYGEMASSLTLGVLESGHKIIGILRWEKLRRYPIISFLKNIFFQDSFTALIKTHKIPEMDIRWANSDAFKKQVEKIKPDVILVGSWGEIFKEDVISLPKLAFINCHPSLLPAHRGSNPYTSVIRSNEEETGITFHLVDKGIDTGYILLQKSLSIPIDDTAGDLRIKCSCLARQSVKELLDSLEMFKIKPKKQDESKASYYPQPNENDAKINWDKSALEIHNQIRGLTPWMECYTMYKNEFLMIKSSKIVQLETPELKAGRIISKNKCSLLVSTATPNEAILLDNVKVYGFGFLSKFFINKIKVNDYLKKV